MRRGGNGEEIHKNIPTETIYYVFSLYLQNRTKTLLDMALIKCEECGQMVSDKASACPHCGCPVKVPMVCPECGEAVLESLVQPLIALFILGALES